jgi:DNA-binding transcriptional MerR regulator
MEATMEYTIQILARLAGISTRTLRYYDEISLLKPARTNSSGYRIYGENEIDMLQQIMFYRELGVDLESIKKIITASSFDGTKELKKHREKLLEKRDQLNILIANVEKSIDEKEGRIKMSDKERFEGFKKKMIDENEEKYGKEVREKYGEETVEKSNAILMNMTEEEYAEFEKLGKQFEETLKEAFKTGDPACKLAQEAARLHHKWLTFTWNEYSKEAHAGLAQMYVDDERFRANYDKDQPGTAEFLRDAILIYTGIKK